MGDDRTAALPEGTDTVIAGASTESGTALVEEREVPAPKGASGGNDRGLADRFRDGREQLTSQAGERARGLVTQGLERTSEALANVSKMVGDTAPGIEERLGAEYGDYARRAAGAIEDAANRSNPGRGALWLHARAYGPSGARRAIEAVVERDPRWPSAQLRIRVWREIT